jgi:3-methyladenine DNA glycosylase AlkD
LRDRWTYWRRLWDRRIAVLATLALIRAGRYEPTFALVLALRSDPEPLIHKAMGWMLREIGRRDEQMMVDFLDRHPELPRITVRYATERLAPGERARFVKVRQGLSRIEITWLGRSVRAAAVGEVRALVERQS